MGELGSKVRTASCYHNKRAEIQERQWRIQVAYLQLNIIFPRPGRSLLLPVKVVNFAKFIYYHLECPRFCLVY